MGRRLAEREAAERAAAERAAAKRAADRAAAEERAAAEKAAEAAAEKAAERAAAEAAEMAVLSVLSGSDKENEGHGGGGEGLPGPSRYLAWIDQLGHLATQGSLSAAVRLQLCEDGVASPTPAPCPDPTSHPEHRCASACTRRGRSTLATTTRPCATRSSRGCRRAADLPLGATLLPTPPVRDRRWSPRSRTAASTRLARGRATCTGPPRTST
jgi:hypothetical protein